VAYVHTPIRRVWNAHHRAARRHPRGGLHIAESVALALLRRWDLASMNRVHHIVVNSRNTAAQVGRIYGRSVTVIPPPVRTSLFVPDRSIDGGDYFLAVARLDPYKRIDLAIAATAALHQRLVVVGDGVERERLQRQMHPNVTFVGRVDDARLRSLYQRCRALVFPGEDDFGIAPVEAQACGRPVVAFAAGGALETVIDGVTGVLFAAQTVEALVAALQRVDRIAFDRAGIRHHAEQFDEHEFRRRIAEVVATAAGVARA
jgi:glycosyltransferase involved in cell wall biosynthesis